MVGKLRSFLKQVNLYLQVKSSRYSFIYYAEHQNSSYTRKEIDSVNFLKHYTESDNGQGSIFLIFWDKVSTPKCEEGLDIKKIQDINAVLLTKL